MEKLVSSFISGLTTHLSMILEDQYAAEKFLFITSQQVSFLLMKWRTAFLMQLPLEDVKWRAARIDTDQVHFWEALSKFKVKRSPLQQKKSRR